MRSGNEIMFSTVHGSALYGSPELATEIDLYVVCLKPPEADEQAAAAAARTQLVGLKEFTRAVSDSDSRALEALLSPSAEIESAPYAAFFSGMRPNRMKTYPAYAVEILGKHQEPRKFARFRPAPKPAPEPTITERMHALRKCVNLNQLMLTGRFDPRIDEAQVQTLHLLVDVPAEKWALDIKVYVHCAQNGRLHSTLDFAQHQALRRRADASS